MRMSEADIPAFRNLAGSQCVCGSMKRAGCAFCGNCYGALSGEIKTYLRRPTDHARRWREVAGRG
jgi:hypothetical protein